MSNDAMIVHKERIPRLHAAKPVCICPDPILSGFYFKALVSQPVKYFASCGCAATMAR
jgi:hypothetical protein